MHAMPFAHTANDSCFSIPDRFAIHTVQNTAKSFVLWNMLASGNFLILRSAAGRRRLAVILRLAGDSQGYGRSVALNARYG